jgi:hypothetical protein
VNMNAVVKSLVLHALVLLLPIITVVVPEEAHPHPVAKAIFLQKLLSTDKVGLFKEQKPYCPDTVPSDLPSQYTIHVELHEGQNVLTCFVRSDHSDTDPL